MAASDDFKKELMRDDLNADTIRQALKMALSEAIELKITTWVVPVDDTSSELEKPKPGYRMQTRINIVDGNIDNEVGSQFLGNGPYTELREFHISQVQEGRDIIEQNIVNLQYLFGVLASALKQVTHSQANGFEKSAHPQALISSRNPSLPPS